MSEGNPVTHESCVRVFVLMAGGVERGMHAMPHCRFGVLPVFIAQRSMIRRRDCVCARSRLNADGRVRRPKGCVRPDLTLTDSLGG